MPNPQHKTTIALYSGVIPSTTFIERLVSGLARNDISVYVFGVQKEELTLRKGVKLIGYRPNQLSKLWHLIYYSCCLWFLKRRAKQRLDAHLKSQQRYNLNTRLKCYPVLWHRPDIFHVQWAKGIADWIWVQDFGIKLVLSLRGAHINYSPVADKALAAMYRKHFPKVDGFHAVSEAIAVEAQKYGAQKEKIKVVYSGLEIASKPIAISQRPDVLHILSVGRPHWVKGYTYALDACKILRDANFNFKYSIIGAKDTIELSYQIHDLGLRDYVELLDYMPYSGVQEFMRQSDLLLLSSIKEGLANVVLEAMALNTLVLSTDCGGMHEVIVNGENGFLIPIRDAATMAQKITEIANLPDATKARIRAEGIKTLQSHHSSSQMVHGMLELYKAL